MDELARRRRGRHGADPMIMEALAKGASHEEAARAAGVSVRTVSRRVSDPSFRAQLDELRACTFEGIAASLTASSAAAIKTLDELLCPEQPATVRASAARTLLSAALQYRNATVTSTQKAEPEDLQAEHEQMLQLGEELIRQAAERLETEFKASQDAGRAPPDPPACIRDHVAGECDACAAWQETAHAIVLEYSIDHDGRLSEIGSRVREQVWPLRLATIQRLNAAYERAL